jgi:hypothetical protein
MHAASVFYPGLRLIHLVTANTEIKEWRARDEESDGESEGWRE